MERETFIPSQPQKLQSLICLAFKKCWGNGNTEFVGVKQKVSYNVRPTIHLKKKPMSDTIWMARNWKQDSMEN